jgi:hypothetical protein
MTVQPVCQGGAMESNKRCCLYMCIPCAGHSLDLTDQAPARCCSDMVSFFSYTNIYCSLFLQNAGQYSDHCYVLSNTVWEAHGRSFFTNV